ncbi:MAG: hypothetical protein ACRDVD_08555 [Acidimicrobiia bacterium]
MDTKRARMELLRPAVDHLRRALQRMDDKDVPAGLRSLADSSARKVTPPLLARAIAELDASQWLRDETAAEGDLEEGTSSALFVNRPPGWEERFAALVDEASSRTADRKASQAEKLIAGVEERSARLEAELRAVTERATTAEQRGEARLQTKLEAAQKARRSASQTEREERRRRQVAEATAERLAGELAAAEARVDSLRQLLERGRRTAADTAQAAASRGWFPTEPTEMAVELDRLVKAVRRPILPEIEGPSSLASVSRLPDGIRPDRAEAVRWLIKQSLTWFVDGYNLAFKLDEEPNSLTRDRVLDALGRIVKLSTPATMAVAVFDSSVDTSEGTADRRVGVIYAPSADEWILDQARPGSVVVTSDRRVREGAEEAGAIGLWSEALAAWIRSGH